MTIRSLQNFPTYFPFATHKPRGNLFKDSKFNLHFYFCGLSRLSLIVESTLVEQETIRGRRKYF